MSKFKFQFEHVLRFRKLKEDEALKLLSEAQKKYKVQNDKKNHLIFVLKESLNQGNNLKNKLVHISSFKIDQDFISGTKQRIIQSDHAVNRARREVEKTLRNYLFFRRQTRTIEILQEKAFKDYKKAQTKKEQKEMDELVVMRFRLEEDNL